jgi:hypothetical protein
MEIQNVWAKSSRSSGALQRPSEYRRFAETHEFSGAINSPTDGRSEVLVRVLKWGGICGVVCVHALRSDTLH